MFNITCTSRVGSQEVNHIIVLKTDDVTKTNTGKQKPCAYFMEYYAQRTTENYIPLQSFFGFCFENYILCWDALSRTIGESSTW